MALREREGKKKFVYKRNDEKRSQFIKKSASAGAGYDNPYKPGFPVFLCKDGDYRIRILPATWEGAEGYDLETYVHFGIGVDNGRFLCPKKTEVKGKRGRECPICDEYEKAKRAGDDDYAQELRPAYRPLVWIIDRNNPKDGPQLFPMPFTLKQEIARRSVSKKTGAILYVDDPEEGHDIEFSRESKGKKTTYGGVEIDRDSTPLSDNPKEMQKWLDFIQENPLPDTLLLHDETYIADVLGGGKPKKGKDDDEEEEQPKTRSERRKSTEEEEDTEDESPRSKKRRQEEEDDEDTDEDEDRPVKKRKVAKDEDPDDEDEDEPAPKKRKKVVEDEDEIDDDEEELDEDDEDEPPAKKSKRKPDPDPDDEDEEESEDEDEEPAPKSKKRKVVEEEDDEDDSEDEDEEEEERRPLKKRR